MVLKHNITSNHLSLAAILFGVVLLLTISVPRFVSSVLKIDGNQILTKKQLRHEIPMDSYDSMISSFENGLFLIDDGGTYINLGLAKMLKSEVAENTPIESKNLIASAKSDLEKGLAIAPLNPYGWIRLAHTIMLLEGPSRLVVNALKASIQAAYYEPQIMHSRLEYCFLNWDYFSEEDREIVYQQLLNAWKLSPDKTFALASSTKRVEVFRAALLRDRDSFRQFQKKIYDAHPK